jgi:integrase
MSTSSPTLERAARGLTERLQALAADRASLTVGEIIERRLASYAGRDTAILQRLATWRALVGDFKLEAINRDVVWAAREELQTLPALVYKGLDHEGHAIFKPTRHKTKSPATVNRYMAALSGAFAWAIEQRLAPFGWANPCRGIKRMPGEQERVRFLSTDERSRLFAACRESRYPRLLALVATAMLTGARKGELLGLTWRDVDLERRVARLGRTKNGDRRTLVLLPQVVEVLRPFESTDRARYVFGAVSTRGRTPAAIDTAFRAAVARASIRDFRFHDLRHCCASYLAQAGKPLNVIQEILGHRKMDMTRRYAHLTVDTKAQAMHDALGGIDLCL